MSGQCAKPKKSFEFHPSAGSEPERIAVLIKELEVRRVEEALAILSGSASGKAEIR